MADFDDFDNTAFDDSEQDERQTKIAAFEKQVARNSKILLTRKMETNKRIEAAYWLGESGVPHAITALRKVYRSETNARVKSAAEYALGQFKALYESVEKEPGEAFADAVHNPENRAIFQRLEAIALEGKMSKPSRISRSLLMRLQMGLGGLLIVLVVLNIALMLPGGDGNNEPENPERTRLVLPGEDAEVGDTVNALYDTLDLLSLNSRTLQAQFTAASGGADLACSLMIMVPSTVTVSSNTQGTHPNLAVLARRLEAAEIGFIEANTTFTDACAAGQPPAQGQIDAALAGLESTLSEIPSIEEGVNNAAQSVIATATEKARPTETPITPTDAPTETPTFTPEPTATLEPELVNVHIRQIQFRIDQVTASRGAIDLLERFWVDAADAGRTDGCREARPPIPEDYTAVIPPDVLNAAPQLARAQENMNIGLSLLRQGWDLFQASCSAGTLSTNAQIGNQTAQAASNGITEAILALNTLAQERAAQAAVTRATATP